METTRKESPRGAQHSKNAVVRAGSALVADIAATLDGDAMSRKGWQEKVSGWLARYDFAAPVRDHLWSEGVAPRTRHPSEIALK